MSKKKRGRYASRVRRRGLKGAQRRREEQQEQVKMPSFIENLIDREEHRRKGGQIE